MSRNGSGVYSLPVPPFTPGTVILSADVNSDFSDIATALTGSIAADGQTPITGQLRGSQASAPTYSITGDLNTGFGSSSADTAYIQCGGINTLVCTTVGATITGTLSITGATTFGTITDPLTVVSTDAGAANGPILDLFRDSASPAVSDLLGLIQFNGRDSAANKQFYALIFAQITDPTSTTEDANLFLQTIVAGVQTTILQSSGADIIIPGNLTVTGNITDKNPTVQRFTSGTAQTYTPTTGTVRIRVRMAGGGGGGSARTTNNGNNGTNTSFGSWVAAAGALGTVASNGGAGGSGGADGTGTLIVRIGGGGGDAATASSVANITPIPGRGGSNAFGGGASSPTSGTGLNGITNTGGGGSGGGSASTTNSGSGGGAGEYVEFWMTATQIGASQSYTVGAGGLGGAAGGTVGGNGAAGIIIVEEFYS